MTYEKRRNHTRGEDICTGAIAVKKRMPARLSAFGRRQRNHALPHARLRCVHPLRSCAIQAITFEVFIGAEEKSGVYIIIGTTVGKIS
jgi:hypothetical protein